MPRTVLLHHELPDHTWHYDWLLARDGSDAGEGAGPLISFRVRVDIREAALAAFEAVRMPDHRAHYLQHEGEVSGGRGTVQRVAEGVCRVDEESTSLLAGAVSWGGSMRRFEAMRSQAVWQVRLGATDVR